MLQLNGLPNLFRKNKHIGKNKKERNDHSLPATRVFYSRGKFKNTSGKQIPEEHFTTGSGYRCSEGGRSVKAFPGDTWFLC